MKRAEHQRWKGQGTVAGMVLLLALGCHRSSAPSEEAAQSSVAARQDTVSRSNTLAALPVADPDDVTAQELKAVMDDPTVWLIDIRTPQEWEQGRIPGAEHIPLNALSVRVDEIPLQRHVILYCRSGNRTIRGRRLLRDAGFKSVRHLRGGLLAWDGPIERD